MVDRLPDWARRFFPHALLVLLVFALYAPFLGNEFVTLDDGLLITRNPAVQQITLRSLWFIFTSYDPELYIPLTFLSYQIDHAIYGLNPFGFHLTNLVLHSANALLLFWFVLLFTSKRSVAFLCALLFAIHPLHVEAVLWAASRKDLLSGFFFLLTLGLYAAYRRDGARLLFRASMAAFFLGLLAKVSILLLPIILLLIDWAQGRRDRREMFLEKIPFFAVSVVFGVIAYIGKRGVIGASDPVQNALLGLKSAVFYLQKLFIPDFFSVIYPQQTPVTLVSGEFLLPFLLVVGLLGVTAYTARRSRFPAFCVMFYFVMLVPNFTNFYKNEFLFFASDRYAYLASIGLLLLMVSACVRIVSQGAWRPRAGVVGTACVVILLSLQTLRHARVWNGSEALYRNVLAHYPSSTLAHNNLGDVLWKTDRKEEAEREFRAALAIDPALVSARVNMGGVYMLKGDAARAIDEYRLATKKLEHKTRLNIDEVAVYYLLAQALETAGETEEALDAYKTAAEKAPDIAETHYNLGLYHQKYSRVSEAIAAFEQAVTIDGRYIAARYRLASLYAERGRLPEAKEQLEAVVRIDPNYERAGEHLMNINRLIL